MTPTEQDKELREKINHRFDSVCTEGHQQSCGEYQTAVDDIMQLITADRKRVALEARIDELKRAESLYSRTYKQEVTDNAGNVYVNDSHGYLSSYEVQERIAELKAQQEEEQNYDK